MIGPGDCKIKEVNTVLYYWETGRHRHPLARVPGRDRDWPAAHHRAARLAGQAHEDLGLWDHHHIFAV